MSAPVPPPLARLAPWLEGAVLAAAVLLLAALGGPVLRASYHGLLHAAVGEAVLRDGLLPENPFHAGVPLRYYTLYPALGVLLGRLGCAPLWGFVLLNALGALAFGPSLDALGRALRLSWGARRAAFLAAVLGFNALGWLWALLAPGPAPPPGAAPVLALRDLTLAGTALAWDARLQAFLPKFWNVSSFAPALAPLLLALAGAWRILDREATPAVAFRRLLPAVALPAALTLALNPLAGAWLGLGLVALSCGAALGGRRPALLLPWAGAGAVAVLLALPFLLPALGPGPEGPSLLPSLAAAAPPLTGLVGPVLLLLVPGVLGLVLLAPGGRRRWLLLALLTAVLVLAVPLPWGNEYKLCRLLGILWALPAGAWAAGAWTRSGTCRVLVVAFLLAGLPTTILAARAYLRWSALAPPLPVVEGRGRLEVRASAAGVPGPTVLAAEAAADTGAPLLVHPFLAGARIPGGVVQGFAWTPALHRPLVVDAPQVHNDGRPDLAWRLDRVLALWGGRGWPGPDGRRPVPTLEPARALAELRGLFPGRPLLVLAPRLPEGMPGPPLAAAGGELLAEGPRFRLWRLPPPGSGS